MALLDSWLATQPHAALRLLGVGVSDLSPATQLDLFTTLRASRNRELDAIVDQIRQKFGSVALKRASSLEARSTAQRGDASRPGDRQVPSPGIPDNHSRKPEE
jgi:hypothetical protein